MGIFKGIVALLMAIVAALVIVGILGTIPSVAAATYFNEIKHPAASKLVSLTAPSAIVVATAGAIALTNWRRHRQSRLNGAENVRSAIAGGLAVGAEFHIAVLTSKQILESMAERTSDFIPKQRTIELEVELSHIPDPNILEILSQTALATFPELMLIILGTAVVMLITGRACTMSSPSRETVRAGLKRDVRETWEGIRVRFGANPKAVQRRRSYERAANRVRNA